MILLKKLSGLFFFIFSAFFIISIFLGGFFYYYGRDLPSESTLLEYSPPMTTRIYSSDDELIEEYAVERRVIIPFEKIPMVVKGAFIVAEDKEFYDHSGINVLSLLRAVFENTAKKSWTKKPAGGSTITQQIAKNLLVGATKSFTRKIREAIMAFRIEATIKKDKILEIYLNQLYLGKGCYGVVEACNYYFEKPIEKIEAHEAAFLAAIPSAPSVYISMKDSAKLLMKRNSILYQMYELGYISKAQLKDAVSKPISLKFRKHKIFAPYFSDEIFRIFSQQVSKDSFFRRGYSIKTTMNKQVQYCAEKALEDGLIEFTKSEKWRGILGNVNNDPTISLAEINKRLPAINNKITPCVVRKIDQKFLICETYDKKRIVVKLNEVYKDAQFNVGDVILCRFLDDKKSYEPYQTPDVAGGIVVMDLQDGDTLGMAGGFSFDISSFNCITQAMRQPGSTIKPFVYAAAIENGKDEYDIIEDKSIAILMPDGSKYSPHNYTKKRYGKTYLRDGVIYSRNLSTVNLALEIGLKPISKLLSSAGLVRKKVPISAVLGAVETTPLKMLSAFSAFFNKGVMVFPRFVTEIRRSNRCLKDDLCNVKTKRIMSEETAETMKNILHDVVKYGTAKRLLYLEEKYGVNVFGKTGTTNDFKDAWFVGCIVDGEKSYMVCVFVGYSMPKSLGEHCTGSKVALPIFANFVENLKSLSGNKYS
ncbi:MAG: transglycosylase domain-containing protein [Holosporales bacterium]|jgi:penicillin-binding protein 1A|nr:transglycosylase domain-containing protein [Holosporales bacterium]